MAVSASRQPTPCQIITNPGPDYGAAFRLWQGIPSLECLRVQPVRGSPAQTIIYATWYTGGVGQGPGNHVILVRSLDDGATWSEPLLAIVPPTPTMRAFDPCLWYTPEGQLWIFWAQSTTGSFDGIGGVWTIQCSNPEQENLSWSKPRHLHAGVMANRPARLLDGSWAFAISLWNLGGRKTEIDNETRPGVHVLTTNNYGKTFRRRGSAQVQRSSYEDPIFLERLDKIWQLWIRTESGISVAHSDDYGQTWKEKGPIKLPLPSSRFAMRRLESGRLLVICNLNPERQRSHLTALLSEDDGDTFLKQRLLLDPALGAAYPDAVEDADGVIRVIYEHGRGDINWPSSSPAIRMARFTETDIIKGKPSDSRCQLGIMVNQLQLS